MKISISIILISIFFIANIKGQSVSLNEKQTNIINHKQRQLVLYFDKSFLSTDLVSKTDEIANAYSSMANSDIRIISKQELKELRDSDSANNFVIVVSKVNEVWKSRSHACNKKREHSYISFSVKLSEKNVEIGYFNTTQENLSNLDYYTSYYVINSILDAVSKGVSWKEYKSYAGKDKEKIENKTLVLSDSFVNISFLESSDYFPKHIVKENEQSIIDMEDDGYIYAYPSSEKGSAGKNYKTVIIDLHTKLILQIYNWEKS